jgi:hypothetical protein
LQECAFSSSEKRSSGEHCFNSTLEFEMGDEVDSSSKEGHINDLQKGGNWLLKACVHKN